MVEVRVRVDRRLAPRSRANAATRVGMLAISRRVASQLEAELDTSRAG